MKVLLLLILLLQPTRRLKRVWDPIMRKYVNAHGTYPEGIPYIIIDPDTFMTQYCSPEYTRRYDSLMKAYKHKHGS